MIITLNVLNGYMLSMNKYRNKINKERETTCYVIYEIKL